MTSLPDLPTNLGPCADCPAPAIVGLRGTWLCLAHFEARLDALVQAIRQAVSA